MSGDKIPPLEMDAEIDFSKIEAGSKELQKALSKLDPSLQRTEKGMKDVEKAGKSAGKSTGLFGSTIKELTVGMTAATLAADAISRGLRAVKDAFVNSFKAAVAFEEQLVQVRKVTNASGEEMQRLKGFIEDLAVQTGIAKEQLADIAAGGGRLGIFDRDGLSGLQEFTRVIAMTTVAMEDYALSSGEASDKTARLLNLFGEDSSNAEELLSIINELSNTAAATSSNIADNVENFASLSQSFGASKESLLALATTMEEVGSEPQAFSTGFQTALIEMQKDTDKFATFLGDELGPKFKEAFAEEPVEAFAIFLEGLRKTGRDIGSTLEALGIGDRRLIRELQKLATDKGLERFAANLETAEIAASNARESVSSLQQEFERAGDTTGRRLRSMGEAAENVGKAFSEQLQPQANTAIDAIIGGLEAAIPLAESLGRTIGGVLAKMSTVRKFTNPGGLAAKFTSNLFGGDSTPYYSDVIGGSLVSTGGSSTTASTATDPAPVLPSGGGGAAREVRKAEEEAKKRRKAILEFEADRAKVMALQLEVKRDTVGLTEREEQILTRLEGAVEEAFDVRVAEDFEEMMKALNGQTDALVDELEDVTGKIERIQGQINSLMENSKERVRDLTLDLAEFSEEAAKEDEERLREQARKLAEALVEAKKVTGGFIGGELIQRDGSGGDELEARRSAETIEGLINKGDKLGIAIQEELQRVLDLQRGNAAERLIVEQEYEDARLEQAREAKKREMEMNIELEKAFQEGRLDEFLQANEEELSASQEAHAAELQSKQAELQQELTMQQQLQQQITEALLVQIPIRNQASEAYKNQEVDRLNQIRSAALQAAAALAKARRGGGSGAAFADGGPVIGPGGPKDDAIDARLSNGEHVLTANDVRAMGGQSAVLRFREALHSAAARLTSLPKFANGGPVGKVTNNNSKSQTFNFYGEAARVAADPTMIRWHTRK